MEASTLLPEWVEWAKALGPLVPATATAVVAWLVYRVNKVQAKIAKEKIKQDLYDRRYKIFISFLVLLRRIATENVEKKNLEEAYEQAQQANFILSKEMVNYLNSVHQEAIIICRYLDPAVKLQLDLEERNNNAIRILKIMRHRQNLVDKFMPFLQLDDFRHEDRSYFEAFIRTLI